MKLFRIVPILIADLDLRIIQFNQVSLIRQRFRVDAEVLWLVEQRIHFDELWTILLLHVFTFNQPHLLLEISEFQCIRCTFDVLLLFSQLLINWVEIVSELLQVDLIDIEFILLISQSLLLKSLGDFSYELLWVVLVKVHLLLHVAADVHPLVQLHDVFVAEVGHEGLYANWKGRQLELSKHIIFVKTPSEIADLFNLKWILVEVLYRVVLVNSYVNFLCYSLFVHFENAGLKQFLDRLHRHLANRGLNRINRINPFKSKCSSLEDVFIKGWKLILLIGVDRWVSRLNQLLFSFLAYLLVSALPRNITVTTLGLMLLRLLLLLGNSVIPSIKS